MEFLVLLIMIVFCGYFKISEYVYDLYSRKLGVSMAVAPIVVLWVYLGFQ